jgi:galactosylceramide sulfotransferase
LQHNSYSFDFGITSTPNQAQVTEIITALNTEFDLVMITEYMDESLIMLKRIFCWEMDDIMFGALCSLIKFDCHFTA